MNKPHKHAEIIKLWADGANIQVWHSVKHKWMDIDFPQWNAEKYRIKPKTIQYRVALFYTLDPYTVTVLTNREMNFTENLPRFVRWLTDWIEVEV